MRPRPCRDGAAALAACALLLMPTSGVEAQPAAPADPAAVVRELVARYVAGARAEKRCLRLESLTVDAVSADVFDVTSTMTVRAAAPGSPEWWESSRSRISLQREGDEWRIAASEPRERELVERLVTAAAADRPSLLESSAELHTTTFVRLAGWRAMDLLNQGHYDDAAMLTSTAIVVAERLGDAAAIAAAMSARSSVLRLQNDLDGSLTLAEEALSLAEGGGDPDVLANALVRLARTRERTKGIPDPELFERAVGLAAGLEDVAIAAHAAVHLGRAYESRGRFREAFRYAQLASRFAEQSGDRAARFSAAVLLRGAFSWIRELGVAHRYGLRAAELAEEGGYDGPAASVIESRVGEILREGHLDEGRRMIDEALKNARSSTATAILLRTRAGVYRDMGRFDDAERDLDQVVVLQPVDASFRQEIALDRASVARLRGDYDQALTHLSAARGPNARFDRPARYHQAELLNRSGRIDEARAVIEELIAAGSTLTQLSDPQRSLFQPMWYVSERLLAELLVAQGDCAAALRVSEEVKGRALAQALSDRTPAPVTSSRKEPGERALEERIRTLNRRLAGNSLTGPAAAAIREQLGAAREDLLDLRQGLYAEGPAGPAVQSVQLCIDDLPSELDDVTIVSYVISEARTLVFVLEPKRDGRREVHVRSIELTHGDLNARTDSLAALVEQRNLRAPAVAAEMYDLLIGPIEPFVREARSLCVIPDDFLWHVPFHALGPDGGPLLVDRLPLFYAPSVTVLATMRPGPAEPRDRKPRLLAFANPAVEAETAALYRAFDPDAPLGAIPETEPEVRAIGRIYGREASRIYVGKTARETTLKQEAPGYDVLHIATHGMVYESAPMFSALLLRASSEDESDDGVLEAREIAALALDADLTVLSACETGRANPKSGVIGLSWAFLAAGCRTTVVSQWKAHSAASAVLMVEFHRQLARGLSKPEALRRAQLLLRRDRRYRHPFYWAPFMVIGRP